MSKEAIAFLKKDKALNVALRAVPEIKLRKNTDLYLALMRAIVGQQLSVKAARTIWERFLKLFPDGYPDASQVITLTDTTLRGVGLSFQKAGYIRNIAQFSLTNTLDYKKLKAFTDDELIDYLVQIKGVGRWTAEMILMFNLCRPDVFPRDDLGIQTGIRKLYNLRTGDKKQLFSKMEKISENWRPYRTIACMYIWKYKDLRGG